MMTREVFSPKDGRILDRPHPDLRHFRGKPAWRPGFSGLSNAFREYLHRSVILKSEISNSKYERQRTEFLDWGSDTRHADKDQLDGKRDWAGVSLDVQTQRDDGPPGVLLLVVDHRGLGLRSRSGAASSINTAGWLVPADSVLSLLQPLLGAGSPASVSLAAGSKQRVVAIGADAEVIAVDRLQSVAERVDPLGDRLVAVVVPLTREPQRAEQLALGQEREQDRPLRTGRLPRRRDRLAQPELGVGLPLAIDDPIALPVRAPP